MIHIPLIDKVLGINTVNNKAKRKLNAMAKEVKELSMHPKWKAFLEKHKDEPKLSDFEG